FTKDRARSRCGCRIAAQPQVDLFAVQLCCSRHECQHAGVLALVESLMKVAVKVSENDEFGPPLPTELKDAALFGPFLRTYERDHSILAV
ncbi:MAG: hypothetical protein QOI59_316, partial [Gammaproteobacteria bacterium]|nr:hypothetical protein [Gammaproteobacteria bacterium]